MPRWVGGLRYEEDRPLRDWQYTSTAREALERERVRRLRAWGKLEW
jgi:hypothetical protein